jgi:hypothetical protein
MDKRKGYVLLLINAGIRSSASERKKSRRLLHYVEWHPVITLVSKRAFRVLLLELGSVLFIISVFCVLDCLFGFLLLFQLQSNLSIQSPLLSSHLY